MIEKVLETAMNLDEAERTALFAQLADTPESSLEELAKILQRPLKYLWPITLQAIRAIGYPHNASLLSVVTEHLVDGNWPGWQDAINILVDVDPATVASMFIAILLDLGRKREMWNGDVEGICAALPHMKKEYSILCVPSLLFVLSIKGGLDEPDPYFLLRVLEHAEVYHYSYALPVFIYMSIDARQEEIRTYAKSIIKQFSNQDLALYKDVAS